MDEPTKWNEPIKYKTILLNNQSYIIAMPNFPFKNIEIYSLEEDNKIKVVGAGDTLKEACMDWLNTLYEIDNLILNMEIWAKENDIPLDSIEECGKAFDTFVETLSGEELFAMLSQGDHQNYVNWSI